jgi:hypothetical protein
MSNATRNHRARFAPTARGALAVGLLAAIVCAVVATREPTHFCRAYLPAYVFFLGLALGSLALTLIYHLTGGAWGFLLRRILEAAMGTLPLLAILFLPIAWGIAHLYRWAQPAAVAADAQLQHQQFYLSAKWFWLRAAGYFVVWLTMAWLLRRWSAAEEREASRRWAAKSLHVAGVGAVLYGVTIHFAAIDWLMSLETVFHSTIWGPMVALGQLVSALAVAIIVLTRLRHEPAVAEVLSGEVLGDLASLLLTLLIVWTYLAWFQYMLVWIANLPVDVIWYVARRRPMWQAVAWVIAIFGFAIPFFLLLFRKVKRHPARLAATAALIACMQLVVAYYEVLPTFPADRLADHLLDFLTPLAIGGLWLSYFLRQLAARPLLAAHDYNQAQARHLRALDEEKAAHEEALLHG